MNPLPDQFSAARQAQLDNGFNLMRSLSDQAFDRTSRVLALQFDATRTVVEQSSNAMRQLLAARDPRDLLAFGSQSQQHLSTMLDYGRELFSIAAAGMSVPVPGAAAASAAGLASAPGAPTVPTAPFNPQSHVQAGPVAEFAAPTESASASASEASISVVTSDVEPGSAQTAIARAASEALDMPVAPPHPVAASMPVEVAVEIELPKVEPVDATPPPAAVTGRPAETRGSKGRRKQG